MGHAPSTLAAALAAFSLTGNQYWHRYMAIETSLNGGNSMSYDFEGFTDNDTATLLVCVKAAEDALLGKVILPIYTEAPGPLQLQLKLRYANTEQMMNLVETFTRWLPNDIADHSTLPYQYITVDLGLQFGLLADDVVCMEYGVLNAIDQHVPFSSPRVTTPDSMKHGWSFEAFGSTGAVFNYDFEFPSWYSEKFPFGNAVPPMRIHAVVPRDITP
jgi:hypothetical protein